MFRLWQLQAKEEVVTGELRRTGSSRHEEEERELGIHPLMK